MGNTLTSDVDKFTFVADTFDVSTRSIITDSVLARSSYSYMGCIKDPETGSYITGDYMSQFSILEDESDDIFAKEEGLTGFGEDGAIIADSCHIEIMLNGYMGDSLAAMKMNVAELVKPVEENRPYYTNFDPETAGYIREDGLRMNYVYSVADLTKSDSIRNLRHSGSLYETITIPLNDKYTDKNGKTYNNYGSYLIRQYYDHPEYFKNSQTFIKNVCPGFYFKTTDGLGVMTEVEVTRLMVYYRYVNGGITYSDKTLFNGTGEVLQTTHFTRDKKRIERLAAETEWTYLKAPDGIFTEVTLPIDDIKRGHENDTLATAKIVFRSMNELNDLSDIVLQEPENLLLLERDSIDAFFLHRNLPTNINSYLATYNSSKNSYTFNNISGLINHMYANRGRSENWNKAVLIPVQVTRTASSTSSTATTVASVSNEMRVTSVRLVGGKDNRHEPVQISIIYNVNQ